MDNNVIRFIRTHADAKLPVKSTEGAAGFDLFAVEPCIIRPGKTALVSTGYKIMVPPNTEAQVRSRSGLALKRSVCVLNSPGTIDEDYQGPLGVILINHGEFVYVVSPGDRIAQLVLKPVIYGVCEEVEEFHTVSARGEGGYGSTGY